MPWGEEVVVGGMVLRGETERRNSVGCLRGVFEEGQYLACSPGRFEEFRGAVSKHHPTPVPLGASGCRSPAPAGLPSSLTALGGWLCP